MKEKTPKAPSVAPAPTRPVNREMGNELVCVDAVYHLEEVASTTPGPWNAEAEKVAWTDSATGYGCIIRRSLWGGHLEGYVGVAPGHPLFGYSASALRDLGLRVHGGISYAEPCQGPEPEDRSVCHVSVRERMRAAQAPARARVHDRMWWIGFECNQPTDIVPRQRASSAVPQLLGTVEQVYRDEGYVLDQCRRLSEQLKAASAGGDASIEGCE